jgi:hypothetical protein
VSGRGGRDPVVFGHCPAGIVQDSGVNGPVAIVSVEMDGHQEKQPAVRRITPPGHVNPKVRRHSERTR